MPLGPSIDCSALDQGIERVIASFDLVVVWTKLGLTFDKLGPSVQYTNENQYPDPLAPFG